MPSQIFTLFLAPLRGITDALFRQTFSHHFTGIDLALAPFITPQQHPEFPDKMLRDLLPENNQGLPVIPQLIHSDSVLFLILAKRLTELGYTSFNWNLGCPASQVAKKKRGSGLLPYPEKICQVLDTILPELEKMGCTLSIKMRLGYHEKKESLTLLPRLNNYPLQEIIIHPRLGKQLYRGTTDVEGFEKCLELSNHTLIYNGDIINDKVFFSLQKRFPAIQSWMIGRGILANPFLAEEIKKVNENRDDKKQRLYNYHQDLFHRYSEQLSGPGHLLGRMKQLWNYLIASFPEKQKRLKKILKSTTVEKYRAAVEDLF